jgi:hypothetical protein
MFWLPLAIGCLCAGLFHVPDMVSEPTIKLNNVLFASDIGSNIEKGLTLLSPSFNPIITGTASFAITTKIMVVLAIPTSGTSLLVGTILSISLNELTSSFLVLPTATPLLEYELYVHNLGIRTANNLCQEDITLTFCKGSQHTGQFIQLSAIATQVLSFSDINMILVNPEIMIPIPISTRYKNGMYILFVIEFDICLPNNEMCFGKHIYVSYFKASDTNTLLQNNVLYIAPHTLEWLKI